MSRNSVMRKDVKVGLVLSLVVVVLAGWYFVGRSRDDKPVPIAAQQAPAGKAPVDAGAKADVNKNRPAARNAQRPVRAPGQAVDAGKPRVTTPSPAAKPAPPSPDRSAGPKEPASSNPPSPAQPVASEGSRVDASGSSPPTARPSLAELLEHRTDAPLTPKPTDVGPPAPEPTASAQPGSSEDDIAGARPADTSKPDPGREGAGVADTPEPRATRTDLVRGTLPAGHRIHVVGQGDTLAILAELYYGSQRHQDLIVRANPGIDPSRLLVGTKLVLPPLGAPLPSAGEKPKTDKVTPLPAPGATAKTGTEASSKAKPVASSQETYLVQTGDSFYKIAEKVLGDASRWPEIFDLNKEAVGGKPERLKVGQTLKLPVKEKEKPSTATPEKEKPKG